MAQRRMFSPQIVESEEFLSMPVSSQALYFHLGMNADDDGFIQPRIIMRQMGSTEDDLKVLLSRRFLLTFETGVVVIKHWLIHNLIQKDRYHPTRFQEEKKSLILKENKAYTDNATCVNKMLPEVRLGKVRLLGASHDYEIVSSSIGNTEKEPTAAPKYPNALKVFDWFHEPEPSWNMNTTELKHGELLYKRGEATVKEILDFVEKHREKDYFPKITKPSDLERKWVDIQDWADRNGV